MTARAKRFGVLAALLLGVLVWVWGMTRSDAARVERVVREVAAGLSARPGESEAKRVARVRETLSTHWTPEATIEFSDGRVIRGQSAIAVAAATAIVNEHIDVVEVTVITNRVDGGRATLFVELGVSTSQRGDLHGDRRQSEVELVQQPEWRISRVIVGARTHEQPEARP